jgi:hypothetical protein
MGFEYIAKLSVVKTQAKLAHGRSGRLSARARDRDHSNPESPSATLFP